ATAINRNVQMKIDMVENTDGPLALSRSTVTGAMDGNVEEQVAARDAHASTAGHSLESLGDRLNVLAHHLRVKFGAYFRMGLLKLCILKKTNAFFTNVFCRSKQFGGIAPARQDSRGRPRDARGPVPSLERRAFQPRPCGRDRTGSFWARRLDECDGKHGRGYHHVTRGARGGGQVAGGARDWGSRKSSWKWHWIRE
ncbi:hypothetical protein BC830DRAFT_1135789, partial [Chytriomyces sp. MP71]